MPMWEIQRQQDGQPAGSGGGSREREKKTCETLLLLRSVGIIP